MPPVIAAVIEIGVAVAVHAGVISAIVGVLITIAATLAITLLAKKPTTNQAASQGAELQTRIDPSGPRQVGVGYTATGGSCHFAYTNTDESNRPNKYLYRVIVLSDRPSAALNAVLEGSTVINFDGDLTTGWRAASGYRDKNGNPCCFMRVYLGSDNPTADASFISWTGGQWTTQHKGTGLTYVLIRLAADSTAFPNGEPNFTWHFQGASCYDDRKDSTKTGGSGSHRLNDPTSWEFSQTCSVITAQFLRGFKTNGVRIMGVGADERDMSTSMLFSAHNTCEQQVAIDAGYEPRYVAGAMLTATDSAATILQNLQAAMDGKVFDRGGAITILPGANRTPALNLSDDDIDWTQTKSWQPKASLDQMLNCVTGNFVDAANFFTESDLPVLKSAQWEADDGGERFTSFFSLPHVNRTTQGQRITSRLWKASRYSGTCAFVGGIWLLEMEQGDWFTLSTQRWAFTSKYFEVQEITLTKDMRVAVVGREVNPNADNWDHSVDEVPRSDTTWVPPSYTLPIPAISLQSDKYTDSVTGLQQFEIKVSLPTNTIFSSYVKRVELQYSIANTNSPQAGPNFSPDLGSTRITGLSPEYTYYVRARTSDGSRSSDWSGWYSTSTAIGTPLLAGQILTASGDSAQAIINAASAGSKNLVPFSQWEAGASVGWGLRYNPDNLNIHDYGIQSYDGKKYLQQIADCTAAGQTHSIGTKGNDDSYSGTIPVIPGARVCIQAALYADGPVASRTMNVFWYKGDGFSSSDIKTSSSHNFSGVGAFPSPPAWYFDTVPSDARFCRIEYYVQSSAAGAVRVVVGDPLLSYVTAGQSDFLPFVAGPNSWDGATRNQPAGAWNSIQSWKRGDIVTSNGSSYEAIRDVPAGVAITDESYWQLYAKAGTNGIDGTPGHDGSDGHTFYNWIAFADDNQGLHNFTTGTPGSRSFIGFATNKSVQTPSTDPSQYTWTQYTGPAGFGLVSSGGTIISGNKIIKTESVGDWNSGAYSAQGFYNGAQVTMRCGQALSGSAIMAGLNSDPASDNTYQSIDYAFYFSGDAGGTIYIVESGGLFQNCGNWDVNTAAQIVYDGKTVSYYLNGYLQRQVAAPANLSLWFDSTFATVNTALIIDGFGPAGTSGRNGVDGSPGHDGTNGTTFWTWVAWADDINGQTNFQAGGASGGRGFQGLAFNKTSQAPSGNPGDYTWAEYKGPANFGLIASGPAVISSNKIIPLAAASAGWGTAGVYSSEGWVGGAQVSMQCGQPSVQCYWMAGLNTDPSSDNNYTSIDYAFFVTGGETGDGTGHLRIYENGGYVGDYGAVSPSDVLSIVYDNAVVRYSVNGVVKRAIAAPAGLTLFFDSAVIYGSLVVTGFASAGTAGTNGTNGADGTNGTNGTNGVDGLTSLNIVTVGAVTWDGHNLLATGRSNSWTGTGAYSTNVLPGGILLSHQRPNWYDGVGEDAFVGISEHPTATFSYSNVDFAWRTTKAAVGDYRAQCWHAGSMLYEEAWSGDRIYSIRYDEAIGLIYWFVYHPDTGQTLAVWNYSIGRGKSFGLQATASGSMSAINLAFTGAGGKGDIGQTGNNGHDGNNGLNGADGSSAFNLTDVTNCSIHTQTSITKATGGDNWNGKGRTIESYTAATISARLPVGTFVGLDNAPWENSGDGYAAHASYESLDLFWHRSDDGNDYWGYYDGNSHFNSVGASPSNALYTVAWDGKTASFIRDGVLIATHGLGYDPGIIFGTFALLHQGSTISSIAFAPGGLAGKDGQNGTNGTSPAPVLRAINVYTGTTSYPDPIILYAGQTLSVELYAIASISSTQAADGTAYAQILISTDGTNYTVMSGGSGSYGVVANGDFTEIDLNGTYTAGGRENVYLRAALSTSGNPATTISNATLRPS